MSNLFIDPQIFAKPSANPMYRTTHSMLLHYSDMYKDYRKNAKGTKELLKKMKTENITKLYNNRLKWDTLCHRIPIEYMEALGITEKMIATTIEIDQEIYDKAIAECVTYEGFTQSRSIITKAYAFDEVLNEPEAIEEVRRTIMQEGFLFFGERFRLQLHRPPYYTIWFNSNGDYHYSYQRPEYRIREQYYEFNMPFSMRFG